MDISYYIHNRETGKMELHFDKTEYDALTDEQRSEIKSAFLWGRRSGCWISRAKEPNLWRAERVAQSIGLGDGGEQGERLSFASRNARQNAPNIMPNALKSRRTPPMQRAKLSRSPSTTYMAILPSSRSPISTPAQGGSSPVSGTRCSRRTRRASTNLISPNTIVIGRRLHERRQTARKCVTARF